MSRARIDLLLNEKDHTWDQEGWFLPLAKALDGVTAEQAAWQPPGGGNSIWALLAHLNHYNEHYLRRFTGQEPGPTAPSNTATFAIPDGPNAETAWAAEVERASRIAAEFRVFLDGLTDEGLEALGKLGKNLPHLILHDAYHTGQIVALRKQQGAYQATREY